MTKTYAERHQKLVSFIEEIDETVSTQYRDAKHVQRLRDEALRTRSQTLNTTYEEALEHYRAEHKQEPWLILAKESARDR